MINQHLIIQNIIITTCLQFEKNLGNSGNRNRRENRLTIDRAVIRESVRGAGGDAEENGVKRRRKKRTKESETPSL